MKTVNRTIACALIVSVIGLGMPSSSLAGIVATDEARGNIKRDQVTSFLERSDVRDRMQALGVDPDAARTRVAALSDDEVAALVDQLDQLPAGGSDVLTAVVVVFLILVILDLLGVTNIFPFTKSMRK
ncbi:MAG: PA2779 family protein [Burkholderiales bacterium]